MKSDLPSHHEGYSLLSHLAFHLMSMEFRLRDSLRPPIKILKEAGMHSGMTVLDFGCGPGGFSVAAARLVGRKGRVYALDIHPLAIRWIQCRAAREHLDNIQTIFGTSMTEVPGETEISAPNSTDDDNEAATNNIFIRIFIIIRDGFDAHFDFNTSMRYSVGVACFTFGAPG